MTHLLLIDTCGEGGGIGIARNDQLIAHRALPGRETQERLMTELDEVLNEAGTTLQELAAIAIVTGPGSFTGVRIGLAAAQGLAVALDIPLLPISRLAVLAAQSTTPKTQAWIDAGRGDVFVGTYTDGLMQSETMLPGPAALEGAANVIVMEARLAELLPPARRVPPVGVAQALPLALKHPRGQDPASVDANYLRVPDAELAFRARAAAA